MSVLVAVLAVALILLILIDSFESMVLPRRVSRRFRPARFFYIYTWKPWRAVARRIRENRLRGTFLSLYGPLSMLMLLAFWATGLVVGFGLLHWALQTPINAPESQPDLLTYLYLSGATFSTLGFGDVTAREPLGRILTVGEAGLGFGFLAVVIGYLPVLYQAFSRREVAISGLDARAGSPPSVAQLLLRFAQDHNLGALNPFLAEWERWCAELLESHISFPVLCYYRSQHDNQSWLAALTAILDTCALLIAAVEDIGPYQAKVTLAAARHAVVDLSLIFFSPPGMPEPDRWPPETMSRLRDELRKSGVSLREGPAVEAKLKKLRGIYEPFLSGLSTHFMFPLPPVMPDKETVDNWQTSAWMRRVPGISKLSIVEDEHFD